VEDFFNSLLEVVHLDQLYHLPHTDWSPRPPDEFAALHDEAIMGSRWVIEGNYSRLLTQRLERATGFILLDVPTTVSLYRYLRRCWLESDRRGALEGGRDSVKWEMIRHITVATRANRARYRQMFNQIRLPKVQINSTRALDDFYRSNSLRRCTQNFSLHDCFRESRKCGGRQLFPIRSAKTCLPAIHQTRTFPSRSIRSIGITTVTGPVAAS
jgi:adenylate kinase family enzyme